MSQGEFAIMSKQDLYKIFLRLQALEQIAKLTTKGLNTVLEKQEDLNVNLN